jgi:hypothetical protein
MFRSSADRLHAWLTGAGDMLWGDAELADERRIFDFEREVSGDEVLGDEAEIFDGQAEIADGEAEIADGEAEIADGGSYAAHPHRRPLRWERSRRPGTVAPRPSHCISPVRRKRSSPQLRFR